jgi:hypothetical protein
MSQPEHTIDGCDASRSCWSRAHSAFRDVPYSPASNAPAQIRHWKYSASAPCASLPTKGPRLRLLARLWLLPSWRGSGSSSFTKPGGTLRSPSDSRRSWLREPRLTPCYRKDSESSSCSSIFSSRMSCTLGRPSFRRIPERTCGCSRLAAARLEWREPVAPPGLAGNACPEATSIVAIHCSKYIKAGILY